jgi:prepilin-type N-terminal cleavage/methylation domain-containing protein
MKCRFCVFAAARKLFERCILVDFQLPKEPSQPFRSAGLYARHVRAERKAPTRALYADRAFTLIEFMVSVAILAVITGAVFALIANQGQVFGTTQLKGDMYNGIRGAAELMAQEIGQAGLVGLPSPSPTLACTSGTNCPVGNGTSQTVPVSSVTSMFVGEMLLIDAGAAQEQVTITALNTTANTLTAVFNNTHSTGIPINVLGVFSQGVMTSSTATQLRLFGNVNADGSLVYIHYDCNLTTTPGTLTRSITTVTPSVTQSNASQTVLNNLISNPNSTPCFQYITTTAGGLTFVTNVAVTLSVQTAAPDPVTHAYLTMTKSYLDLTPRNVLVGVELAGAGITNRLQPTPSNLPLP